MHRRPIQISWQYAAAIIVLFGICTWLIAGGIVLVDSWLVTPTSLPVSTAPRVAGIKTSVPTVTTAPSVPTSTPILSTVTAAPTALANTPSVTLSSTTLSDTSGISTEPANTPDAALAVANACRIPDGWTAYDVQPGDTLFGFELGSKGQTTVAAIMAGNCLTSKLLAIGQPIYLPPGAADNAPKLDDGPAAPNGADSAALPAGQSRAANCPCTLIVRAGWRLEQIAAVIDSTPVGFSGRDFLATTAAGAPTPDRAFLHSRPAGKSLEGFMFPGTYTLDNSTTAVQFRDMLLDAFAANVGGQMQADAAARGLTLWQVIVMASVVQRESYAPSEQILIASVFYNRLNANKGIAATVTLQYALGRPGNWWPRIVGSMINIDSPYNSNLYLGLPPTAIASPGLDAIRAAIYPAQTDYQYFSAKCGGGGNFYTRTFQEFEQGLQCQ